MCRSPVAKWAAHALIFAIDCIARSSSCPSRNATRHCDRDRKRYSKTKLNHKGDHASSTFIRLCNRDGTRYSTTAARKRQNARVITPPRTLPGAATGTEQGTAVVR